MDSPLNNLLRLICHKTQSTNQPIRSIWPIEWHYFSGLQGERGSGISVLAARHDDDDDDDDFSVTATPGLSGSC